jgi:hypothetical protein
VIRDPNFANGISLILIAVLCVRLDVLRAGDVAQIIIAVLALMANRMAAPPSDPPAPPGGAHSGCALSGCPNFRAAPGASDVGDSPEPGSSDP